MSPADLNLLLALLTIMVPSLLARGVSIRPRVGNGGLTTVEHHPYMADLGNCGGSIIGLKWILTAAHCGDVMRVDHVRVGSSFQNGIIYRVKRSIPHPKYNHFLHYYDFMLLELETSLQLSENVNIIPLAEVEDSTIGNKMTVIGWGATETGFDSMQLRETTLDIVENKLCGRGTTDVDICTVTFGHWAGKGDSGGPGVVEGRLVGVVSRGIPSSRGSTIFSKVTAVRNWIWKLTGI